MLIMAFIGAALFAGMTLYLMLQPPSLFHPELFPLVMLLEFVHLDPPDSYFWHHLIVMAFIVNSLVGAILFGLFVCLWRSISWFWHYIRKANHEYTQRHK
jgi:ABC-type microcin C transport system permease subunit YejB